MKQVIEKSTDYAKQYSNLGKTDNGIVSKRS